MSSRPVTGDHTEPLEAILLVGGQGTRLRPLTISTPKPLLPTAGVPFLAHQLARASAAGVTRVVLATSYRADMFADCLGDGSAFGTEIVYAQEGTPLGTGGAIRNAAQALRGGPGSPVLVLNGDVLSGHDLAAQLDLHSKAEAAVTLHLVEVSDPARFGSVPTDADGRVTAIEEIPPGVVVSVERETFPALIADDAVVMGYLDTSYWLDVGTPEAFVQGSCDLVLGRLASPALPPGGVTGEALLLDGAQVGPGAWAGGGTVVGAGSVIEAGARVDGSVLFDGVRVGAGARVSASVLGRGVQIGASAVIDEAVVGDGACVASGNELRAGLRVWPGVDLGPTSVRFSTDV